MDWIKQHKVKSVIIAFLLITFIGFLATPKPEQEAQQQAGNNAETITQTKPEPRTETIKQLESPKYEIVKEFGNAGKAVIISPEDVSEDKLTLLGKELNKKYGSNEFARIGVFTDREQALIHADIDKASSLEGQAATIYDQAYVAQFNVNRNSNLKQYTLSPTRDAKEIKL